VRNCPLLVGGRTKTRQFLHSHKKQSFSQFQFKGQGNLLLPIEMTNFSKFEFIVPIG